MVDYWLAWAELTHPQLGVFWYLMLGNCDAGGQSTTIQAWTASQAAPHLQPPKATTRTSDSWEAAWRCNRGYLWNWEHLSTDTSANVRNQGAMATESGSLNQCKQWPLTAPWVRMITLRSCQLKLTYRLKTHLSISEPFFAQCWTTAICTSPPGLSYVAGFPQNWWFVTSLISYTLVYTGCFKNCTLTESRSARYPLRLSQNQCAFCGSSVITQLHKCSLFDSPVPLKLLRSWRLSILVASTPTCTKDSIWIQWYEHWLSISWGQLSLLAESHQCMTLVMSCGSTTQLHTTSNHPSQSSWHPGRATNDLNRQSSFNHGFLRDSMALWKGTWGTCHGGQLSTWSSLNRPL